MVGYAVLSRDMFGREVAEYNATWGKALISPFKASTFGGQSSAVLPHVSFIRRYSPPIRPRGDEFTDTIYSHIYPTRLQS